MCANQFARRSFIHCKKMPVYPIPAVIAMPFVRTDSDPHLWLSPPTSPVRPSYPDIWTEVGQVQFAVGAIENDSSLLVALGGILCRQFESHPLGRGHRIFSPVLGPFTTGTDTFLPAVLLCVLRVQNRGAKKYKPYGHHADA